MIRIPSPGRPAAILLATAVALTAPLQPLRADGNGSSAPVLVQTTPIQGGGAVTVTVRSPLVGRPVFVTASGSGGGQSLIGVKAPSFQLRGRISNRGDFVRTLDLGGFPAGSRVSLQAVVLGPLRFPHFAEPSFLEVGGAAASFSNATSLLPPTSAAFATTDVDWADLDGDGWIDAVVASEGAGAHPLVLMNQSGAGFAEQSASRLPAAALVAAGCVELADVDLDGDVDVFLGGGLDAASPAPNLLLLNDGSGFFSVDASFPPGAGLALDAAFGDVDGDGYPDLVVANLQDPDHPAETPDATVLYCRGPAGYVLDVDLATIPSNETHGTGGSVNFGDFDGDGDLDLFIARAGVGSGPNGSHNLVLLNDGDGDFHDVTAQALPQLQDNSFEAAVADFDGDGRLDVFVANSVSTNPVAVHLLLNQGVVGGVPVFADASTSVPTSLGEATDIRLAVEAADVDGDGDPDVLLGIHEFFDSQGGTSGETVLLLNQGGAQGGTPGTFAVDPAFTSFGVFIDSDVAAADFDGDGDVDLYIGSTGRFFGGSPPADRLLRNDL